MNLDNLRNYFYNNPDFVIRIRENSEDLVYYHGIKAFIINKKSRRKKEETIEIVTDILQVNAELIKGISKKKAIDKVNEIRTLVKGLFGLKNKPYIKYNESTSNYKDKEEVLEEINKYLLEELSLKKYFSYDNKKLFYKIDTLEEFVSTEYEIVNCFTNKFVKRGWKKPDINLWEAKKINLSDIKIDNEGNLVLKTYIKDGNEIKITQNNIKEAIEKYEKISFEEEKNYQHQFMVNKFIENKIDDFKNILRFEEEYYTSDKESGSSNNNDRGRIDNVFINIDNEGNGILYLIELKYGYSVLGGSNGLHKHLADIKELLTKDKDKFIVKLMDRVNYRIRSISKLSESYHEVKQIKKINYWVVMGYGSEIDKKEIIRVIKEFYGDYSVCDRKGKKQCQKYDDVIKHYDLPEDSASLEKEIEKTNKYCNVRIFLDDTIYDKAKPAISLKDTPFEELK